MRRCVVALCCVLLVPNFAWARPSDPAARRHLDAGQQAYNDGDFETAVAEYSQGYAIEPDSVFLYSWAQAERQRGRCADAVRLYQRFIDTEPPEEAKEYARQGILRCAESMANEKIDRRVFLLPNRAQEDGAEPEPPPQAQEPEETPIAAEPAPTRDEPWYRDPVGGALVGVGIAGVGVGVGFLAAAAVDSNRDAVDYAQFTTRQDRIRRFRIAGGVVLGVGAGLLLAGVIRWAVQARNQRRARASVFVGSTTAGVVFSGRF